MNPLLVRICALSAGAGGLLWIWKAGSILVTGVQPSYIFELGAALAAVGLLGLYAVLPVDESRAAKIGLGVLIWRVKR